MFPGWNPVSAMRGAFAVWAAQDLGSSTNMFSVRETCRTVAISTPVHPQNDSQTQSMLFDYCRLLIVCFNIVVLVLYDEA